MSDSGKSTVVLDSSALVALLTDGGRLGDWVADEVTGCALAAPHVALFEVASILRRQQLAGEIDASAATLAHTDLRALPLELWPYALLAEKIWELREHLNAYDAAYVALADLLGAPVVTLDAQLAKVDGLRCTVHLPPGRPPRGRAGASRPAPDSR